MADNWQVGDLALCVRSANSGTTVSGRVYEVTWVEPAIAYKQGFVGCGLKLKGVLHLNPSGTSCSRRFRKVTTPAADEFDRETIALMNRSPTKEPVQ